MEMNFILHRTHLKKVIAEKAWFNALCLLLMMACILPVNGQTLGPVGLPTTTPAAAFSLRKVVDNYNGAAIRVRRSSDNLEADIYFDAFNAVSTSSIANLTAGVTLLNTTAFIAKAGTINATAGFTSITGISTAFTTELVPGDLLIDATSMTTIGIIASITNNTNLTLVSAAATSSIGTGAYKAVSGNQSFAAFFLNTSCFINTWYDQSGNGKNMFRAWKAGYAYQPRIVSNGSLQLVNGQPAIFFQSTSQYLVCSSTANLQTVNAVRNLYAVNPNEEFQTLFAAPASGDFSVRLGYGSSPNPNDWVYGTGNQPKNWVNSIQTMDGTLDLHTLTATAASSANSTFSLGTGFLNDSINNPSSGRGMKNNIAVSELILFAGTLAETDRKLLECNQLAYYHIADSLLVIPNRSATTCSGSLFTYKQTTGDVTYTWSTPVISPAGAVTGANAQASPVALFSQSLNNVTSSPATATYTVTPATCGVSGTSFQITITVNPLPAIPVITADYCTGNGFVKLTSSAGTAYLWNTGETTPSINVNSAGVYSVTTTNGPYGCGATASITVAQELAVNGNFEAGATGFSSAYINDQNNTIPEGNYAVRTDASLTHPSFYGKDHTTGSGNFMIVNGMPAPAGAIVWSQSNITVLPNTTYYFSAWGLSVLDNNNAVLQFTINGFKTGSIAYLPKGYTNNNGPYTWVRFFGSWNSGASTTANIEIANLNTQLFGNDFGLDDISFGTLSPVTLSAVATANAGKAVCTGSELFLTANAIGGASPFTYSWTGPNGFIANTANPSVTNNATSAFNGTYNLLVTDAFGCQVTTSTTFSVKALPLDITPTLSANNLCAGTATNIILANTENGVTYQLKTTLNVNVGAAIPGNGGTIILSTPLLYTTTTFIVYATNDNAGCSVAMSVSPVVTILTTPVLKIANQAVCTGFTVDLTAPSVTAGSTGLGTLSYWLDAGATIAVSDPVNINISGTYYILSTAGSCSDIEPVTVSINSTPSAGIDYASPFCSNAANPFPAFINAGVAGTFSSTAGLVFVNQQTGQINLFASMPGTYTITNQVIPAGCTPATATAVVTITAIPKADFSYTSNGLCQSINVANESPVFGLGAVAGYFSSTFGLSLNTSNGVINIAASTPGSYAVWNTIDAANGCPSVADTTFIDINPYTNNTTVLASASLNNICIGQTVNLYAVPPQYLSALLREKFNSGGIGWVKDNLSFGGAPANAAWTIQPDGYDDGTGPFSSNDNSHFYFTSSSLQGGGTTAVLLKSPVLSTVGFTSLSLDFFQYFRRSTNGVAVIEVSTNGTLWNTIATYAGIVGSQNAFANTTIDLNAYIGFSVFYVRFKYDAVSDGCWAIDNISITGNSNNYTYSWASFPAGFTAAIANPTGVAPTANSFYLLTATNSYGCSQPATPVPVTVLPAQTLTGITQPSVSCIGIGAVIRLTGLVPNSVSIVNYSIAGVGQAPIANVIADASGNASFITTTLSAANNGEQLIITSLDNGTCIKIVSLSLTIAVQATITWQGTNSSNWLDAQNWCGGIPNLTTDVLIPNTPLNFPEITSTGSVKNITIQNGANILLNGGTLKVSGIITNNGIFDAAGGAVELVGTAAQTITGSMFVNNSLGGLIVSNTAGTTISSGIANVLKIKDSLGFGRTGPGNFLLNTGDNIVLVSNAAGTARVADITNNGTSTGNQVIGLVTAQRYFQPRRAWRMFSAPLAYAGAIFDNLQNGGVYQPGVGTLVSGPGAASPIGANGLDWTPLNNASLKINGIATEVLNTRTTNLSRGLTDAADNNAFFIFARGDRNINNYSYPNTNPTVLNSKGKLQTGTQVFNVSGISGGFTMLGNPYASPVDLNKLVRNNVNKRFYMWDPFLNTEQGGYVVVDDFDNDGVYSISPTSPGGLNQILQSGQAFYVETLSTNPASVVFNENAKATQAANLTAFRPASPAPSFRINYHLLENGQPVLADGVLVEFSNNFNTAVDGQDVLKSNNVKETIGLVRLGKSLAIERYPLIVADDTLYLKLTRTVQRSYRLEFISLALNPLLTAFLQDSYTGTSTQLNTAGTSMYNFIIDANAASALPNRFRIVFKQTATGPLPVTYKRISAYKHLNDIAVDWTVENEINIIRYEVEKSLDGNSFNKIGIVKATGTNSNTMNYNWIDATPVAGNNYYRVVSIGADGRKDYTRVVVVKIGSSLSGIRIYPNPVTNGIIGIEFKNMAEGKYQSRLYNASGQLVYSAIIIHAPGGTIDYIQPTNNLVAGTYQLEITASDLTSSTIQVIVK